MLALPSYFTRVVQVCVYSPVHFMRLLVLPAGGARSRFHVIEETERVQAGVYRWSPITDENEVSMRRLGVTWLCGTSLSITSLRSSTRTDASFTWGQQAARAGTETYTYCKYTVVLPGLLDRVLHSAVIVLKSLGVLQIFWVYFQFT